MSFNKITKANICLILLSGLSTNAMELDIEGHTVNFKPKITVTKLANTDDRVCAIEGVDDLTTPLGLAGTIVFMGLKMFLANKIQWALPRLIPCGKSVTS